VASGAALPIFWGEKVSLKNRFLLADRPTVGWVGRSCFLPTGRNIRHEISDLAARCALDPPAFGRPLFQRLDPSGTNAHLGFAGAAAGSARPALSSLGYQNAQVALTLAQSYEIL